MVAGDRAANPTVPTVFPTNALSILDKSGLHRNIPKAGMAKPNILRLEDVALGFVDVNVKDEATLPTLEDDDCFWSLRFNGSLPLSSFSVGVEYRLLIVVTGGVEAMEDFDDE